MENSSPSSVSKHMASEKKSIKRKQIKIKKLKIKLSLNKRLTELVNYAHNLTQNLPEVDFAFADILCNLKVKLKERYKNKFIHSFNLKE